MHRFYLPATECRDSTLRLTGREAHHALQVLRLRCGEQIALLDGAGHEFLCEIHDVTGQAMDLRIVQKNSTPPPSCPITLLQAIPKGKLFESVIQKATELGAHRIVPILSERVTMRIEEERAPGKVQKWRQAAIEAIKQCGSPWLPQVEAPITLKEFLARQEKFELPLIASLAGDRRHPGEFFREFQNKHRRLPASVCIWIGPEGDFTPAEVAGLTAAGALPITLGKLVLRTETATVYCLSILNYELQRD